MKQRFDKKKVSVDERDIFCPVTREQLQYSTVLTADVQDGSVEVPESTSEIPSVQNAISDLFVQEVQAATNSVTVTMPAAYMESLTAGTHTFNFNFKDGSTSVSVNVVEAATTTTKATAVPTGTNTQKQVKEVPKTACQDFFL